MSVTATAADYLTREAERELCPRIARGDLVARETLWRSQVRFASQIALRFAQAQDWDADEAIAEAHLHLWRLTEKFNPDAGRFSTLVGHAIWRKLAAVRNHDRLIKLPTGYRGQQHKHHAAAAATLNPVALSEELVKLLADERQTADLERGELVDRLGVAIDQLDERRGVVVRRRLAGESYDDIAAALGVTRQRVEQLQRRAERDLRALLLRDLVEAEA